MKSGRAWRAGLGLAALVVIAALWLGAPVRTEHHHATHLRPDGKFAIVVIRRPSWLAVMPGQGSDGPGVVRLIDRGQRVLQQVDVAMVQQVEKVEWLDQRVTIKLVADWPLPE